MTHGSTASTRAFDLSDPPPVGGALRVRLQSAESTLISRVERGLKNALQESITVDLTISSVRVQGVAEHTGNSPWWLVAPTRGGGDPVALSVTGSRLLSAIDRALGGAGIAAPITGRIPEVTLKLAERVMKKLGTELLGAVVRMLEGKPCEPGQFIHGSILPRVKDHTAAYLSLCFTLGTEEHDALWILLPMRSLPGAQEPKVEEETAPPAEHLGDRLASIEVELARCQLSVEEVQSLAEGDLILFEEHPGSPARVLVGGQPRFEARLGAHRGKYAIEILRPFGRQGDPETNS